MTPSQRATLTKQLLKKYNYGGSSWGGKYITIQTIDGYYISYHYSGRWNYFRGFRFHNKYNMIGMIRLDTMTDLYSLKALYGNKPVTREAFHDAMREHPPLMEWILFNGF